jgi:hypothetical protein
VESENDSAEDSKGSERSQMIEVSIKDVFGKQDLRNVVYIVRSPDEVAYVGMTEVTCVSRRMALHIGDVFNKKKSQFSQLLFSNHPNYFGWKVQILSLLQAKKFTGSSSTYDCLKCAERGVYDYFVKQGRKPAGNAQRPRACVKASAKNSNTCL